MIEYSKEALKQLFPIGTIVENNGYKKGIFKELEKIYIMENLIGTQLYKIVTEKENNNENINRKPIDTTVSVLKPNKGHWENGNSICPCCGEDKFKDLDADIWSDWKPNYCPNCGADMRESEGK